MKKRAELNNITLTQPQKIAGISMPAGTKIKTDSRIRRSKPEPDKFIDAEFPQPVMWYGIPIKRIERQLTGNQKWANIIIRTQPAQTVAIGQWLCDKNHSLGWLLQKESVDRISYHQSAEPYVYLYRCFLKDGQVVSLPAFQATFPAEALVRENDPLTDVEQGLWLVRIDRFDKEKVSQAMNMDFSVFDIMTDSQKVIHDFLIQLNNAPERHCGLPKNTLLAWRKSEPDVIQVVSSPTIPSECWGKKLQRVSADEMQKNMSKNHDVWHFIGAKQNFAETPAQ